jgi:hypothetical protein
MNRLHNELKKRPMQIFESIGEKKTTRQDEMNQSKKKNSPEDDWTVVMNKKNVDANVKTSDINEEN